LVAANGGSGIHVDGASTSVNPIVGNQVGAHAGAPGNNGHGILVSNTPGVTIGGTTAGSTNLIVGNALDGIAVAGSGATGTQILDNFIGTDGSGTLGLGNRGQGIYIGDAAALGLGSTVTGVATVATVSGNLISGNSGNGVWINGNGSQVNTTVTMRANTIGAGPGGSPLILNGGAGVLISNGASGNSIGGSSSSQANFIWAGSAGGIVVSGTTALNNTVVGNLVTLHA
jgi:titin